MLLISQAEIKSDNRPLRMIIQTISLKDPNGRYLSCKSSNGKLAFDQVDLDPSCKFFMVSAGAGRTCLMAPNGRFVDLHDDKLLCDGVTTGVSFVISDTTLRLDSGKYMSNATSDNTITVSYTATSLVIKATSFESFNVSTSLCVPAITYDNIFIEDRYMPGRDYLVLKSRSGSIDIIFSIPYSMEGQRNGTVDVILKHMRDNSAGGLVDIELNGQALLQKQVAPTKWQAQNMITLSIPNLSGENRLSIKLSKGFLGNYCLSDAALVYRDNNGYVKQENSVYARGASSGSSYNGGKLEDDLRHGDPYLTLDGGSGWSKISFTVREELLNIGNCVLKIRHRREPGTSIDIYLNGNEKESRYDDIPTASFGIFTLAFHSNQLQRLNELVIKPSGGKYYISDVSVDVVSLLPDLLEQNFNTYVKNWILHHRKNIAELHQIPRDDIPAWNFVREAPYWFFLPFLPASPDEVQVLIRHYYMRFISVGFEIRALNNQARDFHRELISTDLPRKNALRHAYWTALLSRRFGLKFALDLSTAHEEAHVDLTIEGPFDHVTDKINNAVGSLLGWHSSISQDLQTVVDAAWEHGELAYAKDFRETAAGQTAKVSWQGPLDKMAKKYNVKPNFSPSEKATLKRMRVTEPDVPVIHELSSS